jgi:hypothetical protein
MKVQLSLRYLNNVALRRIIAQQLLDEIDMREDHATAAISVQAELVHGVAGQGVSVCAPATIRSG